MGAAMERDVVTTVTVLMAVYDTPEAMLDRAIASIRRQTLAEFEFLILDDGSRSDGTRACLLRHAAADPRIRLRWESHRGLTRTLNCGLALASGKLIARQDADDWSEPERLDLQVAFFAAHPEIALCGTGAWMHQEDGSRLWPVRMPETAAQIAAALWRGNPFLHGSAMFRADAGRALGGYHEEFPCSQDYDFFWRLTEAGGAANLAQPLYHYRYAGGAVSAGRAEEQARAHRAAQKLAEARRRGQPEDVAQALADAAQEIACGPGAFRAALKQADHRMLAGDYRGACRVYRHALVQNPRSALAWGKLARWAVFAALPPAREACFR
jgi:glycosyltransferase involved in cell wall biosynthesis